MEIQDEATYDDTDGTVIVIMTKYHEWHLQFIGDLVYLYRDNEEAGEYITEDAARAAMEDYEGDQYGSG